MKNQEAKKSSNKKIAIVLGVIAFLWYVASMFTLWK
jgi:flagellar basal body-associated protein FliL